MSKHLIRATSKHLMRNAAGHLVIDCEEEEPTCDIACTSLASAYTILGVSELAVCSPCNSSAYPAWDGVVEVVDDLCQWNLNSLVSIGGKQPSYAFGVSGSCPIDESTNGVGLWFNAPMCRWELAITCRTSTAYLVIWAGTKSVEFSPAGVYTRVCGCDETETLTVV